MIDDDLNEIISELNASGGAAPARREARGQLEALLEDVIHRRGSDLLLVAGSPPAIRIDGAVERLSGAIVDGLDIEELGAAGAAGPVAEAVYGTGRCRRVNPSAGAGPVPNQPAPRAWTGGGGHPRAADAGPAARRAFAAAGDRSRCRGCRAGW